MEREVGSCREKLGEMCGGGKLDEKFTRMGFFHLVELQGKWK